MLFVYYSSLLGFKSNKNVSTNANKIKTNKL